MNNEKSLKYYKFRPINDNLIDELTNQYIYFAPSEQFNDPIDCFKDIYWEGDNVLWSNFFQHYLLCLENTFAFYIIGLKLKDSNDIPIFTTFEDYEEEDKIIFNKIKQEFFNEIINKEFIELLINNKIYEKTLLCILKYIHFNSCRLIQKIYLEEKFLKNPLMTINNYKKINNNYIKLLLKCPEEGTSKQNKMWLTYLANKFIDIYDKSVIMCKLEYEAKLGNRKFLLIDFPEFFMKSLHKLLFANTYITCFSSDYKDTKMWSHYAKNHSGICLIFKPKKEEHLYLNICISTCYNKNGRKENWEFKPKKLKKVTYTKHNTEFNFFQSMGCCSMEFNDKWFVFDNKKSSYKCIDEIGSEKWRKDYWDKFNKTLIRKYPAWKSEKEYRIILTDYFDHIYTNKDKRKIKYNFEELEGIIFGVKTRFSDKLKILKILNEKSKQNNNHNIKIYQANFDCEGNIVIN